MKILRRIDNFFNGVNHDLKLFNAKSSLAIGVITLILGIISWFVGGRADRVTLFFIFPRSAMPLGLMYFLWAISFAFIGIILGGVLFGCEKYKRRDSTKIAVFLILSYLFSLCFYTVFFKTLSPFITFILIIISEIFCLLAILSSIRCYALWSLCMILHMLWLIYNGYVAISIALIN